jgi:hypothetical protein
MESEPNNVVKLNVSNPTPTVSIEQQERIINRSLEIAASVLESDSRRMSITCRTPSEMPEQNWHQLADTARCLISAAFYLRNRPAMIAEGEKQVMAEHPLPAMPGDAPGIIRP